MAKNGVYTAGRFAIYILSGIIFIPFLKNEYGWGNYGLIALAGFLTQYVGLVSRCVGNSIARFLNIALNKNDWMQANEIFSTALVANVGFILLQLPFFILGIWKLEWLIDFPAEAAFDFRILVICNVLAFFISMMTGVFITPIQAANRLDISSTIDSIRIILRLGLLFLLITQIGAKLWVIGVVDLGLSLLNGIITYVLYRRLTQDLVCRWKYISRKWVRPIMNMAGWTIVTVLGGCLFLNTDVWMINRFVDKEMAGVYAVLLVWPNFLRQLGKQLAAVLAPVYLIDYARGDIDRVARLSMSSSKLLGCVIALMVGGLFALAEPLLSFWLSSGAEAYVLLFRIMIIHLVFTIGEAVLWQIYPTVDKVHFAGIVSLASGVLNVALSLLLIHLGFGAIGVAIGTAVTLFLSCGLAIPLGVCREFHLPYTTVWWNLFYAALMFFIAYIATLAMLYISGVSVVMSGVAFILLFFGGVALASRFVLTDSEQRFFITLLQKTLARIGQT